MSLMEEVLSLNNDMRSEYDLDEREKVANVTFKEDDVNIITEEDVLDTTGQIDMFDEDAA